MSEIERPGSAEPEPAASSETPPPERRHEEHASFLPNRQSRFRVESFAMRLIATAGIVGIGTALAAILGTQDVKAWIVGLVVSAVSVLLAAVLWSSRTL
jgi:hypothetical protein